MDSATLWTAVGAIGTCVGAAATVLAIRTVKSRPTYISLQGRWRGGFNDEWEFLGEVRIKESEASGRFRWKLIDCSPGLPWAKKKGRTGYELVAGKLEAGILSCGGTKIVPGAEDLLTLANYTIPLPSHDGQFEGTSVPQKRTRWEVDGKLFGTATYLKRAPAYFQD